MASTSLEELLSYLLGIICYRFGWSSALSTPSLLTNRYLSVKNPITVYMRMTVEKPSPDSACTFQYLSFP